MSESQEEAIRELAEVIDRLSKVIEVQMQEIEFVEMKEEDE